MTRPVVELTGSEELLKALKTIGVNADAAIEAAVKGASQNIRSQSIRAIQRPPKTGRIYDKKSPSRSHRASAPGESPATDTGALARSIVANVSGKTAEVVAAIEYAAPLEFGTSKMAARPFMVPALETERPKFNQRLRKIVEQMGKQR
jgi:HK97 gp10 family phage protein